MSSFTFIETSEINEVNIVAQLNNPEFVHDEEDQNKHDDDEDENEDNLFSLRNPVFHFDHPSSKIKAVLDTVEEILGKGEKMFIVSQWTRMLEIVSAHLSAIEGATSEMFIGNVPIKKRQGIIDRFNDQRESLIILLLSLTVGGVGLNLVGGNHLFIHSYSLESTTGVASPGQNLSIWTKKNVHIYKFLCNETIEQSVKQLQEIKLNSAEDIFTGHQKTSNNLSLDDLRNIFEM